MSSEATLPPPPADLTGWPWNEPAVAPERSHVTAPKKLPRITVITPSFNQGQYLEATIRSVLLQRYPNLQYIVVDGGSSDQSSQVIHRYAPLIDHVIQEPDKGQSDAICKGLVLADGELFNWINSDDLLAPGVLWNLAAAASKQADLYAFCVQAFDDQQDLYTMRNRDLSALAMLRADDYAFSQPGLWFRLNHLRSVGGIDASLHYGFDWDLLVRYLASFGTVHYLPGLGAKFRLHQQSKTMTELAKANETENRFKQEADLIRTKLEAILPAELATASQLGRRREPWNQRVAEMMDRKGTSPLLTAWQMARESVADPQVKLNSRTFGAMLRLLSRYVRPKFYQAHLSDPT